MAQNMIEQQVTCKVSSTNGFSDAEYASEDGMVVYLADSDDATGPTPTIQNTPAAPGSAGTETHLPYGALGNRVGALGDATGVSGNQITYDEGANAITKGIVPITIPAGGAATTIDATSIGRGLGLVLTNPPASATDGLQAMATGGKGKIIARNGRTVYWDIRAK